MSLLRAFAIVLCYVAMAITAHAGDPCADGEITASYQKDDTLFVQWTGTVRPGMDRRIRETFEATKGRVRAVVLGLFSCGGNTGATDQVIKVLRTMKQTHELTTIVRHGDLCASACISIFLEGTHRIAALTSSWGFHEPSRRDGRDVVSVITNPKATEQMLREYVADGVSKSWLKRLRAKIKGAEWWQTGRDLWQAQSGIITEVLGNSVPRETKEQETSAFACILCGDPGIGYGQRPQPHLPDRMDMLGMPER